jgi:hypothetical protein
VKSADDVIPYVVIKQQKHENAQNKYANEDSHITLSFVLLRDQLVDIAPAPDLACLE